MASDDWDDAEEIEVPRGAYIGWGSKKGQHVTGTVLDYSDTDGRDFNDDPCPQLEIELSERAASFNKDGERTNYAPGDLVMLTAGQVSLKRAVKKAELKRGDLVKITLENLVKVDKGTVKEFGIKVKRGGGKISEVSGSDDKPRSKAAAADSDDDDDDDEPPF